ATALGLSTRYILRISATASHCYRHYQIPKRHVGMRDIYHPSKELKSLQRWLLMNVIENLPVHAAAVAYRRRIGPPYGAKQHVASNYLLRMDIHDFFPSLKESDLRSFAARHPTYLIGWQSDDLDLFCNLVCRHGRLTIGAPSSPALSNVLF